MNYKNNELKYTFYWLFIQKAGQNKNSWAKRSFSPKYLFFTFLHLRREL